MMTITSVKERTVKMTDEERRDVEIRSIMKSVAPKAEEKPAKAEKKAEKAEEKPAEKAKKPAKKAEKK